MEEINENQEPGTFSNDPAENLRIENELLKLKMTAERDAYFSEAERLPPEIENEWLKNIQRFEEQWENRKTIKVYDLIGKPDFKPADALLPGEVKSELQKLNDLMAEKNVFLDVLGDYEPIVIYKFLTEELLEHETDDIRMPGWTQNFIYEEFHPNHEMDIEKNTRDFLQHWFEKGFNEHSMELGCRMITANGGIFTRDEIINKLNNCRSCYTDISEVSYVISENKFEFNEGQPGMGHSAGRVKYKVKLESGETIKIGGSFKLYMNYEDDYWQIFYFVFPGFSW